MDDLVNLEGCVHPLRLGLYNNCVQFFIEYRARAIYHQVTVRAFFFSFAVTQREYGIQVSGV